MAKSIPSLLLLTLSLYTSSTTASHSISSTTYCDPIHYNPRNLDCSSPSSGDYYGIGVRLGIYFTWIASWIANVFVPDEISGALDANTMFLLSLLVSIFRNSLSGKLAYIDGLVLMQLAAGYIFGCFSIWGYRSSRYAREGPKGIRHFGGFGTHFRLMLVFALSVYGVWFWIEGIQDGLTVVTYEDGSPKPCQCYPLYTFFFNKLLVLGRIHYVYIIMSMGTAIYFGIMLVLAAVEHAHHIWKLDGIQNILHRPAYQTGLHRKELRFLFQFLRFGNMLWVLFSIISVELTLNWNHISSVLLHGDSIASPSQILPLLIGLLSLVRVSWLAVKPHLVREDDEVKPNRTDVETQEDSGLVARIGIRYLVAWLPWLSQFSTFQRRYGHARISSSEPMELVQPESPGDYFDGK